jgi:hypothetical protein
MGESIITRKKGGVSIPQTELPVITFISKNDTSLTFTIRNEDDVQAFVYYELDDDTPDANNITLNGNTTSSNITFSGLTPGTEYILYVWADAFNKSTSQVASNTQTTTNTTANPTITYVSKTFDSITFTVTNNDNATATIYYEENDDTPDANSVVLNAGATSSNLTISGLTKQTSYTVYAQAQATGKLLSSAVSFTETTPDFPTLANPTITFVSSTTTSITFTVTNNASASANIYYEQGDTTPDANFVTLGTNVTSSNLTISGLNAGTSYTVYAQAQQTNWNDSGVVSVVALTNSPPGQSQYTSSGTFTVPAGVTSINVVCIGAGGGSASTTSGYQVSSGGGGGLSWKNNIPVTPGQVYTVTVGAGVNAGTGGFSALILSGTTISQGFGGQRATLGGGGGFYNNSNVGGSNQGGGTGGTGQGANNYSLPGGGGAGGYTGNGGAGAIMNNNASSVFQQAQPGSGGGAGGGGGIIWQATASSYGGGVGFLGAGTSGSGGTSRTGTVTGNAGDGGNGSQFTGSGAFGGGAFVAGNGNGNRAGLNGAVRIIWGSNRAFPSTNTGNL